MAVIYKSQTILLQETHRVFAVPDPPLLLAALPGTQGASGVSHQDGLVRGDFAAIPQFGVAFRDPHLVGGLHGSAFWDKQFPAKARLHDIQTGRIFRKFAA